ncbi:2117_t:CDS:2 [Paraglomus brasilianum]|uniref:2117_t:CDS:1 n=1 Tax=Paraglomus brasilianum TaxID=144538 RepID=A0A9N9DIM5_9GLOM|nr:2117_t:CDS:2 [Paraglomus brasilianum]
MTQDSSPSADKTTPIRQSPFIIGVAGGSASGKKTVCNMIMDRLRKQAKTLRNVVVISLGDFYRILTDEERSLAEKAEFDFDHPSAFDFDLVEQVLSDLKVGKPAVLPSYDYKTRTRSASLLNEASKPHTDNRLTTECAMLTFYVLLSSVIQDTEQRYNFSLDQVLNHYLNYVKPAYEDFVLPTKKTADVIIPRGANNIPAIGLITSHIEDLLKGRAEKSKLRLSTAPSDLRTKDDELRIPTPSSALEAENMFVSVPR